MMNLMLNKEQKFSIDATAEYGDLCSGALGGSDEIYFWLCLRDCLRVQWRAERSIVGKNANSKVGLL